MKIVFLVSITTLDYLILNYLIYIFWWNSRYLMWIFLYICLYATHNRQGQITWKFIFSLIRHPCFLSFSLEESSAFGGSCSSVRFLGLRSVSICSATENSESGRPKKKTWILVFTGSSLSHHHAHEMLVWTMSIPTSGQCWMPAQLTCLLLGNGAWSFVILHTLFLRGCSPKIM